MNKYKCKKCGGMCSVLYYDKIWVCRECKFDSQEDQYPVDKDWAIKKEPFEDNYPIDTNGRTI